MQNFASAAVGISVAVALIRGFARQEANSIGNLWVDLTRTTVYVLLPIAFVAALILCSQGAIQNFRPYSHGQDPRGRHANYSAGSGGLSRSHQDAGNQWRRILQRQFLAPFREPHAP